ncbi:lipopolysaccharide biosynthesis protein [Lentzea nigeriaca]|uniref:lipopolysaccharide biosynthesis protein n=1 Tax=Lentzea nigeriaca TaxID=1128665 RepID=UPI00195B2EF5|nr:oligosaccharide flippase family protein [Lentzea nigeriaca]MBM7859155.1 O-antigen/teichoic acid export membrane protein [Lentzea nigeriaca]
MTRLGQLMTMSGTSAAQLVCNAGAALVATRALSPDQRGLMVLGMTIGSLSALIGGFGTGSAFRRQFCLADGDRSALVSAFARCTTVGALSAALLGMAGIAASAPLIDTALARPPFLFAVGCFTAGQMVVSQVADAWFADGRFHRGGMAAAVTSLGGLAGVLLASDTESATTLLLAQAGGVAVLLVVEAVALRRGGLLSWTPISGSAVTGLLRLGAPTLGLSIGLVVVLRADRYVIGLTAGTAAVGVYSLAATLGEIPRMIPAALGQLCLQDIAHGKGAPNPIRTILLAVAATAAGGLLTGLAAWLLVVPVFGPEFAAARELLVVLLAAEVCFAPFVVASRGLIGGGWTTAAGILGAAGAAGAIGVYGVTGTLGGAIGVAAGSVVLYGGLSTAAWTLLRRRLSSTGAEQLRGR